MPDARAQGPITKPFRIFGKGNVMSYDVDYLVIGAGSGGVRSARIAAKHGVRVAIVEDKAFGGTCVNLGCVPKKFLVQAGRYRQEFMDAAGYGWQMVPPAFDWSHLIARKDQEIARLNGIYQGLLEKAQVQILSGRGRLLDPHQVEVSGHGVISAAHILIATGGVPVRPDILGAEYAITSDEAFHLPEIPARILVVGGGYIAVEFAGLFHGMGAAVTLAHRGDAVLRGFDDDMRAHLADAMRTQGIDLRLQVTMQKIVRTPQGLEVTFHDGQSMIVDQVLCAIGRKPHIDGLGLVAAGVAHDAVGRIIVNDCYQTNVPSIYAVGDVIDRVALTPVAIREGHFVADHLFGPHAEHKFSYHHIATAVFSTPEIATIGMTEAVANTDNPDGYQIYRTTFRPMLYGMAGRNERVLMKMVVARESRRVVGLHMIGKDAAEIIQGFAVAVTMGATKEDFDRTMAIHPTIAEEFVTLS